MSGCLNVPVSCQSDSILDWLQETRNVLPSTNSRLIEMTSSVGIKWEVKAPHDDVSVSRAKALDRYCSELKVCCDWLSCRWLVDRRCNGCVGWAGGCSARLFHTQIQTQPQEQVRQAITASVISLSLSSTSPLTMHSHPPQFHRVLNCVCVYYTKSVWLTAFTQLLTVGYLLTLWPIVNHYFQLRITAQAYYL